MHRVITHAPDGLHVDHVNGDGLDNRKENLRLCSNAENGRNRKKQVNNTSGFIGVLWLKRSRKWEARIDVDGKLIYLGKYTDAVEAAKARDEAARKYHGEFAKLNFE